MSFHCNDQSAWNEASEMDMVKNHIDCMSPRPTLFIACAEHITLIKKFIFHDMHGTNQHPFDTLQSTDNSFAG